MPDHHNLDIKVMQKFWNELMILSKNGAKPITFIQYAIQETVRSTSTRKAEVISKYLNALLNEGFIDRKTDVPLHFYITELGKNLDIQTWLGS